MVRERGSGKTPERVVEALKKAVAAKSQFEVSKQTGLGQAAINRYIKGIGEPTTATLEKLADYFGMKVDFLRGGMAIDPDAVHRSLMAILGALGTLIKKHGREDELLQILDAVNELNRTMAARAVEVDEEFEKDLAYLSGRIKHLDGIIGDGGIDD